MSSLGEQFLNHETPHSRAIKSVISPDRCYCLLIQLTMGPVHTAANVGVLLPSTSAYGTVGGIVVDGTYCTGYNPSMKYESPPPFLIVWLTTQDLDNGFGPASLYNTLDIICRKCETNRGLEAPVHAGRKIELQWTSWPCSHEGPVIVYMTDCDGPCETVDITTLKWFKVDQLGLLSDPNPGTRASDVLIANNNSWTVTVSADLATRSYELRHETIALHAASQPSDAQEYPFCFSFAVTGTGTAKPTGITAQQFYTPTDPGILFNIYTSFTTYPIPGPTLYSNATSGSQTLPPRPTASAAGSTHCLGPVIVS